MIKISIIVPVYNSAPFLESCIKSLLAQTEQSCEFIFVNDGSTDNSLQILKDYAIQDHRIVVINQENKGVSAARNAGIMASIGQKIGFVDADDTVKSDMYSELYRTAIENQCDIVISNFIVQKQDKFVSIAPLFPTNIVYGQVFIQEQLFPFMIVNDWLNSVANKLYDRKLVFENKLQFPLDQQLGEDGIFNLHAFSKSKFVIFTDFSGYYYREVAGSATRNLAQKDYFDRALQSFNYDYKQIAPFDVDESKISELKALRLIENVLSYISIYNAPNLDMSWKLRYLKIRRMVVDDTVHRVINKYWNKIPQTTRFRQIALYCIKFRLTPMLWIVFSYSNRRNKE